MRSNITIKPAAALFTILLCSISSVAMGAPELLKRATYEAGLIDSYQFQDGSVRLFVSPVLHNPSADQNYQANLQALDGSTLFPVIMGNAEYHGIHHGSPNGVLQVPTITGTHANLRFQIGEAAMVFYKDHLGKWKVGPSAQLGLVGSPRKAAAGALREVTNSDTLAALENAQDIFAGHYVLTKDGKLHELTFSWGSNQFNSLVSTVVLENVRHVRAASASRILAITSDNKMYRLVKNLSPVLVGTIHATMVEAAKKTASISPDYDDVIIEQGGEIRNINGDTIKVIRANSPYPIEYKSTDHQIRNRTVMLDGQNKTKFGITVPFKQKQFVYNDQVQYTVASQGNNNFLRDSAAMVAYRDGANITINTGASSGLNTYTWAPLSMTLEGVQDMGDLVAIDGRTDITDTGDQSAYVITDTLGASIPFAFPYAPTTQWATGGSFLHSIVIQFEKGAVLLPVKITKDAGTNKWVVQPILVNGKVAYYAEQNDLQNTITTGFKVDPYFGGFLNADKSQACQIGSYDATASAAQKPLSTPGLSSYKFRHEFRAGAVSLSWPRQIRLGTCYSKPEIAVAANPNNFYLQQGMAAPVPLSRVNGGVVNGINLLDRQGYAVENISLQVTGAAESMIAPYTIMGLNQNGVPYIRGIISRHNPTNSSNGPSAFYGVEGNYLLDTGNLYITNVHATKGKSDDKITATWDSNGNSYTITPKRCKKSGVDCAQAGQAITSANAQYAHLVANGLSSDITHSSPDRMFYDVLATRSLGIFATEEATTQTVVRETKSATSSGGYLSSAPSSTSARIDTFSNSDNINVTVTTVDPDESNDYRFEILTQPQNGVATIGADGLMKYSVGSFYGHDSFTYRVHDGAGYVDGTASVKVTCPAPEIVNVTPPVNFKAWQANLIAYQYRANACNGNQLEMKVTAGTGAEPEIQQYTKVTPVINPGGTVTAYASFADPDVGSFNVKLELSSPSVPGNKSSVTNAYDVVGLSQLSLGIDNPTPNEDQLINATVSLASNDCAFYTTEQQAINSMGCYVAWNDLLLGASPSVKNGKAVLAGYGPLGGPHQLIANVYKVDSTRTPRLVQSLATSINVAPGTPLSFINPSFNAPQRQYFDYLSVAIQSAQGQDCVLTTSVSQAQAHAELGKKVCLFEFGPLPNGLVLSNDGLPKLTGRLTDGGNEAAVTYSVSKFFATRPKAAAYSDSFVIPVTPVVVNGGITLDRPSYAAGLQAATASAVINGQPTCTITNSLSEAKASYGKATPLVCLGEWNALPSWLANRAGNRLIASGTVPAQVGEYPIAFTLYMVNESSEKVQIGSYETPIKVVDLVDLTLNIQPSGASLMTSEGDIVYTAASNGRVGTFSVSGGDYATIRTTTTVGSNMPLIVSGIKAGDQRDLMVSGTNAPAWEVRVANIKMEYEGISNTSKTKTEQIKVAQLPPVATMVAIVDRPATTLVDTEPFTITGSVGIPSGSSTVNYSESTQGKWVGYLAAQEADGYVPITGARPIQSGGKFRFENITYQMVIGRSVVLVAEAAPPEGIVLDAPVRIVSPIARLDFVSGAPIVGNLVVDKNKGAAPHTARFAIQVTQQDSPNLGVTTWEMSRDNGETWEPIAGIMGNSITYSFKDGGRYQVRARLLNKHSSAMAYTDPVQLHITQALRMTLNGVASQLPGRPLVIGLVVDRPDGKPADSNSVWNVRDSDGGHTSFVDTSEITINSDTAKIYEIEVRAKPVQMDADDPESWTTIKKTFSFAWPDPVRVSISGARRIEAGTPIAITSKVISKQAAANPSLLIKSLWMLPDGVTTEDPLDGDNITISLDDTTYSNGMTIDVARRAWIEGAEEQSESTAVLNLAVVKYEFANFALIKKGETLVAPGYLRLQVEPASSAERKKIGTQRIQYEWTVPEAAGLTAKVATNALTITAQEPGEYPIGVTVRDQKGNSQILNYVLNVSESPEHTVSLGLKEGLRYNRAPMTYSLRPVVTGGHPSDKITKYEVLLNGNVVQQSEANRPPRSVVVTDAGQHTVAVRVTSQMQKVAQGTEQVTVNPNKPPVCSDLAVAWDRKGSAASITSRCVDEDGRIKGYRWFMNGVLQEKRTSNRISLGQELIGSSAEVRFEAFDDSGDVTEQTVTLTPPGMSVK